MQNTFDALNMLSTTTRTKPSAGALPLVRIKYTKANMHKNQIALKLSIHSHFIRNKFKLSGEKPLTVTSASLFNIISALSNI